MAPLMRWDDIGPFYSFRLDRHFRSRFLISVSGISFTSAAEAGYLAAGFEIPLNKKATVGVVTPPMAKIAVDS